MQLEFMDFDFSDAKKNAQSMPQGINTNIDLVNAEVEKDTMNVKFIYTATYAPHNSYIRIGGKAIFSGKEVKQAFEEWKKTKRITGVAGEYMVNMINYSASINAVFIARVFNMTPPIMPPTIKFEAPLVKKK